MKRALDTYLPIAFLYGMAAYFLLDTKDFTPGSLLYPRSLAIILIVLNTILLICAAMKKTALPKVDLNRVPKKFALIFLSSALYVVAVYYLGFVLSSLIYCPCSALALGYGKKRRAFLISAVLVGMIYVGFKVILRVPLPTASFLNHMI